MIALLDVDQVCYAVGFTVEQETDLSVIKVRTDEYINNRLNSLGTRDCELYLTDSKNNFRLSVYPDYKGNRKGLVKPVWFQEIRQHLIDGWGAEVIDYLEADDCVSIRQRMLGGNSVLVSDDKDLDQVPGLHMRMSTFVQYEVSDLYAQRHIFHQLLTGDRIDNIPGIFRVGPVKAKKMLEDCPDDFDSLWRMCEWRRAKASKHLYENMKSHYSCLRMIQNTSEYETVRQAMKDSTPMKIVEMMIEAKNYS